MISDAALWAIRDAPVADLEEWAVLLCLAERADDDGEGCWPSHKTMARRLRISVSTIKRRIDTLEERGLIRRGDQSRAAHIREDRRPVVWDLMIPYSWFPNIARIQEWRADHGRAPLARQERPDLPPAPEMKRRADLGKPRKSAAGLVDTPHGGASSSPTGVLVVLDGGASRATNLFPPESNPEERTSAEVSAPGAMTLDEAAATARTIVTAYMDWWKRERQVAVIPESSRAFHMLVGAGRTKRGCHFVTAALLQGISPEAIKAILADHGRRGRGVVPSKPMWSEAIVRVQGGVAHDRSFIADETESVTTQRALGWQALKGQLGDEGDGPAAIGGGL